MDFEKIAGNVTSKFVDAGCEKLPEGPMRENCEKKKKDKKSSDMVSLRDRQAGCEKLPEGPMRDNCEKKKKDKKEAAKGEVPEAFKKEWKNKDKDGDGKENEPMPEGLKKHQEKKKKSSEVVSLRDRQSKSVKALGRSGSVKQFLKDNIDALENDEFATAKMKLYGPNTETNWLYLTIEELEKMAKFVRG